MTRRQKSRLDQFEESGATVVDGIASWRSGRSEFAPDGLFQVKRDGSDLDFPRSAMVVSASDYSTDRDDTHGGTR